MIDLKNTWIKIECEDLKKLWVNGCISQGLSVYSDNTLNNNFDALCSYCYHIMSYTSVNSENDSHKQITLKDLQQTESETQTMTNKTKTDYVELTYNSPKEKAKLFSEEDVYFWTNTMQVGEDKGKYKYSPLTALYQLNTADKIYRKVETTIEWFDNIPESGVLCWVRDSSSDKTDVRVVTAYNPEYEYKYLAGVSWKYATPITQEEVSVFMNNCPQ